MTLPFIPKDVDGLPDKYGVTVHFIDGKKESFEVAQHRFFPENHTLEFVTFEDIWNVVSLSHVTRIEFDKAFSKVMAAKTKVKAA